MSCFWRISFTQMPSLDGFPQLAVEKWKSGKKAEKSGRKKGWIFHSGTNHWKGRNPSFFVWESRGSFPHPYVEIPLWMNFSTEDFHSLWITEHPKMKKNMLKSWTKPSKFVRFMKKQFSTAFCGKLDEFWPILSEVFLDKIQQKKSVLFLHRTDRIFIHNIRRNMR